MITFRNYSPEPFFTDDYRKVREFLILINANKLRTPRMLWGAWEWAVTHGGRDNENLVKMGLWEDGGKLVAVALYECPLGEAFLLADEVYSHLKPEIVAYVKDFMRKDDKIKLVLHDGDYEFQRAAVAQGFRPKKGIGGNLVLDIDMLQSYSLPDGFSFVSMANGWDWQQYHSVMWRGFNHEGEPICNEENIAMRKQMLSSPMINPELVVAVKSPDGNYVSHCGMWYRTGDFYCLVEPVVTIPEYRKMGLGKAVVLEAIRRCGELDAKQAVVGSNQQFYFNIGFYPVQAVSNWELR